MYQGCAFLMEGMHFLAEILFQYLLKNNLSVGFKLLAIYAIQNEHNSTEIIGRKESSP